MDLCDFFCVPGLNYVNSCSPEGLPAGARSRLALDKIETNEPAVLSSLGQ